MLGNILNRKTGRVGVFDSGLGGLTVLAELRKKAPEYDYIYLGDSARAPYGEKSQDTIYQYARQATQFLFGQGCKLVIFACNTASSQALRQIQEHDLPEDKKTLGVIRPIAEYYASLDGKIGVIGTKATVTSGAYDRELKAINDKAKIISQPAPLLVPLIEEGWGNKSITTKILKHYLLPLKSQHISALILACTHYPLLLRQIKRIMGKNCQVSDPSKIVAESFKEYITRHQEIRLSKNSSCKFFTTDDPEKFRRLARTFMTEKIDKIKKVELI
jgi:glutamate racemase